MIPPWHTVRLGLRRAGVALVLLGPLLIAVGFIPNSDLATMAFLVGEFAIPTGALLLLVSLIGRKRGAGDRKPQAAADPLERAYRITLNVTVAVSVYVGVVILAANSLKEEEYYSLPAFMRALLDVTFAAVYWIVPLIYIALLIFWLESRPKEPR